MLILALESNIEDGQKPDGGRALKPKYPNVRCAVGHPDEPGYVLCIHVKWHGRRVEYFERARTDRLGVAVCEACHSGVPQERAKHLLVVCRHCSGMLPALPSAATPGQRETETTA